MEDVNGLGGEEAAVEGAGDGSGEVGSLNMVNSCEALLQACVGDQRGHQLEEGVEVVGWQVGEEGLELRHRHTGRLVPLKHMFYDPVDDE